jgi:hypothetical protein
MCQKGRGLRPPEAFRLDFIRANPPQVSGHDSMQGIRAALQIVHAIPIGQRAKNAVP